MNQIPEKGSYQSLRSGIVLYPSQNQFINQTLTDIIKKVPASFALLVDVTGQVVVARGEQHTIDLVALGSLIAGDLAASQEIARITGQYEDFQVALREGKHSNAFVLETGLHLALYVQVSHEIPLGWARMIIKHAAKEIADMMTTLPVEVEQTENTPSPELIFGDDTIPDLFNDALDDLWVE